jgi:hypothetical protein
LILRADSGHKTTKAQLRFCDFTILRLFATQTRVRFADTVALGPGRQSKDRQCRDFGIADG